MWVPASFIVIGVGLALLARWLQDADRKPRISAVLVTLALTNSSCIVLDVDFGNRDQSARKLTGGDPAKGKEATGRYGCGSCHTIPGINGADANVGPPLTRVATRTFLAGVLPNTPENMQLWIKDPPAVDEKTAMPKIGVTDEDVRNIVAYLYTLR